MPNLPISQFTAITGADVDVDTDELYITDPSAAVAARSKKITVKELVANTKSFLQSGIAASDAADRDVSTVLSEAWVSAKNFKNDDGTKVLGDGVNDDSTGLQKFMTFVVQNEAKGVMPRGDYLCTVPPTIGTGGVTTYQGITIVGEGPGHTQGGSRIVVAGTGLTAALTVKKDAWRGLTLRDFGVTCATEGGATYNLLFDSSEGSQPLVENLYLDYADKAIGVLLGTGVNGEFPKFNNVRAHHILTYFYTTAGQALFPYFDNCFAVYRSGGGGCMFDFDLGSTSGGGLIAIGCGHSTFDQSDATDALNNTVLRLRGIPTATYTLIGGRYEWTTCLVDHSTAANDGLRAIAIKFLNTDFTLDNRKNSAGNTIDSAIKFATAGNAAPISLEFDRCRFDRSKTSFTDVVLDITTPQSARGQISFNKTVLLGLAQPPYVRNAAFNTRFNIEMDGFTNPTSNSGSSTILSQSYPFAKKHSPSFFGNQILNRNAHLIAGPLSDGKAINHLQVPQFREAAGSVGSTAADSPWAHGGSASTCTLIWDWSANSTPGNGPRSASPYAKRIGISANSYVYQDISSIDLNSSNYSSGGSSLVWVCYQALLMRIAAPGIRFALENSSTGKIYDEYTVTGTGTSDAPQLITLIAVMDTTATGDLRVKIENEDDSSANNNIDFAWQFVTDDPNAMFVGASTAAVDGSTPWSAGGESLRLWSRLAVPYKIDTYGSAASPAHGDLESDLYLSKTTEKLTYYASGSWHRLPRPEVSADNGNAAATLTVLDDEETQIWNTAIDADRAVTLSTTNAYNGAKFRIVRTAAATGAFNLNVGTGPLKAMGTAGSFCEVEYNGSAWVLTAYGTL